MAASLVRSGTQDIGTGTYTIFAQVVHEKTGVPLDRIDVILGDSALPDGPMSGGSMVTGSVLNAIAAGVDRGHEEDASRSPPARKALPSKARRLEELDFADGRIRKKDQAAGDPEFADILQMARINGLSAEGKTVPTWEDPQGERQVSLHSYGAQFVEVEWEPEIARLRVSRVVTVIDAGRIINPKAAANQIAGAVVMGVGMGLLEETIHDQRTGQPINGSMADYLMATCADSPEIDVNVPRLSRSGDGRVWRARRGRNRPGGCCRRHHRRRLSRHRRARSRTAGADRGPAPVENSAKRNNIGDDGSRKHPAAVARTGSSRGGLRSGHGGGCRGSQLSQARCAHVDCRRTAVAPAP